RATTGSDGRFVIDNVPLGCGAAAVTQLTVTGSLLRGDGTYLAGSAGPRSPVADGTTDFGNITMLTPFYVVRASPNGGSGVPVDSSFDVYFSEPIDPSTRSGVGIALQTGVVFAQGMCVPSFQSLPGSVVPDAADPTRVRFVPTT